MSQSNCNFQIKNIRGILFEPIEMPIEKTISKPPPSKRTPLKFQPKVLNGTIATAPKSELTEHDLVIVESNATFEIDQSAKFPQVKSLRIRLDRAAKK